MCFLCATFVQKPPHPISYLIFWMPSRGGCYCYPHCRDGNVEFHAAEQRSDSIPHLLPRLGSHLSDALCILAFCSLIINMFWLFKFNKMNFPLSPSSLPSEMPLKQSCMSPVTPTSPSSSTNSILIQALPDKETVLTKATNDVTAPKVTRYSPDIYAFIVNTVVIVAIIHYFKN